MCAATDARALAATMEPSGDTFGAANAMAQAEFEEKQAARLQAKRPFAKKWRELARTWQEKEVVADDGDSCRMLGRPTS